MVRVGARVKGRMGVGLVSIGEEESIRTIALSASPIVFQDLGLLGSQPSGLVVLLLNALSAQNKTPLIHCQGWSQA